MRKRYLLNLETFPPHTLNVVSSIAKTFDANVCIEQRKEDAFNHVLNRVDNAHDFMGISNIFSDEDDIYELITTVDAVIRSVAMPTGSNRFNAVAKWGRNYKRTHLFLEHCWDG